MIKKYTYKLLAVVFCISILQFSSLKAEEKIDAIADQLQIILKDLKTLEKAVYRKSDIVSNSSATSLNEDILTKHLLKLNEIEDQFRELTNKFEEVNFKMDKLSKRVTKIQSDSQLRFSDLESNLGNEGSIVKKTKKEQKKTSRNWKSKRFWCKPCILNFKFA